MTHTDGRSSVFTVLGLQGEEKAGKRRMCTVCISLVSVVYTCCSDNISGYQSFLLGICRQ
jgi:hypothetical protein